MQDQDMQDQDMQEQDMQDQDMQDQDMQEQDMQDQDIVQEQIQDRMEHENEINICKLYIKKCCRHGLRDYYPQLSTPCSIQKIY